MGQSSKISQSPKLTWEQAWETVKEPLEAKMKEVRELLLAKGVRVGEVEEDSDMDDAWGYKLEVGPVVPESAPWAVYGIEFTLDDGAMADGRKGDLFVNCQAQAVGGRTVGRYCPGLFEGKDSKLYTRDADELLRRINGFDMNEVVEAVLGDAKNEGIALV